MKTQIEDSSALNFLQTAWDAIPRRSFRNRNGAMQASITTAISAGMEFKEGDFSEIYSRFRAGFWIGESIEYYYSLACSAKSGANISAAIAWEKYLGRPAILWAEKTKNPARLHTGARFNFNGMRLTVTSMEKGHLIGCTYKEDQSIKNRVRVKYSKIIEKRKTMDAAFRAWIKRIAEADTMVQLSAVQGEFRLGNRDDFRHFDIEEIRKAYVQKEKELLESLSSEQRSKLNAEREEANLARWMAGETVDCYFRTVRLRIKGDKIETSTGYTATISGVKEAMSFVQKRRAKGWKANGTKMDLDEFPIKSVSSKGVQVGCTFVEWSEIDRISAFIKK